MMNTVHFHSDTADVPLLKV